MAINPMIEWVSRDLVPQYCHGPEASAVNTAPPVYVGPLPGRSNRSVPCLPSYNQGGNIIPTCRM
jgi:hypothetical protein